MFLTLSLLALCFALHPALAVTAGSFGDGGQTLISAMMMFVGNNKKVYMLDKAEGNAAQINGHPAWGAVWDMDTHEVAVMDVRTNTFCSSGMHLPNGSFVTFGGNGAVGRGGALGSQLNPGNVSAAWDAVYQDFDGTRSIRILNPCTDSDDFSSPQCAWFDEPSILSMQKSRWYSAAEATGDGEIVIIGGFVNGGYVNRIYPVIDPAANPEAEYTYEYYPPRPNPPQTFQFLLNTSGLNAYAHTFLMPSGKMFVQANLSTVLWDHTTNTETPLPPMPNGVARVYPASGATAMLPLTPANNYTPTILFCGGSAMTEFQYGDYRFPFSDTWNIPASQDCQRITPEPQGGMVPAYIPDDNMLEGRTMGQFIILPNGLFLLVNGGLNGTAGYSSNGTLTTPDVSQMPFGQSLASGPVGTPAIYDPNAPAGSRWSNEGLSTSSIARLYHSSAILLPDASVLIAGSNPNIDVNLTTIYPTQYQAEIFYPPYFSAPTRPVPSGVPTTLSYGGDPFDIAISANSYTGTANDAANSTTVVVTRGGFTTHAMNMGQRLLQLNNTFTVNSDGTFTLHVAQLPPNPNLFQPGPAFLFVNIHGIPSNGTYLIVGNGQIGAQPLAPLSVLPDSVFLDSTTGSNSTTSSDGSTPAKKTNLAAIIGGVVATIAVLGVIVSAVSICTTREKRQPVPTVSYPIAQGTNRFGSGLPSGGGDTMRSERSALFPLQQQPNDSYGWNPSTTSNYQQPYSDAASHQPNYEYDPYASSPYPAFRQAPKNGGPPYRF
ncbi:Aldehyde oxidase GLOX [Psilocybe cubensis]|uniref:Aldehyde oxidase GLOX n=2 Tax=Psilocybe cubensis TaxID=181762 RepID=A0ACB8GXP6_PSICU|nr:Aldehyde oxidase GLOX [Psilocybe cubensis]KAH9480369.1 Aldehyde oxidase GLOX [Psilocybe cubensis]